MAPNLNKSYNPNFKGNLEGTLQDHSLAGVKTQKDLGLIISSHWTWTENCSFRVTKTQVTCIKLRGT